MASLSIQISLLHVRRSISVYLVTVPLVLISYSTTGVHLDEPLSSERSSTTPLTLDRPDSDEPCYLNVDLTGLRGYLPSALELLSESRTIEVYDRQRDEYLDTVRGTMVKTQDG